MVNKSFQNFGIAFMISVLFLVLYCESKHGSGRPLEDYSQHTIKKPPAWAQKGVLYQIFPRVFTEEGTFRALQVKLNYIKNLGVDVIWLMPIFPIGEKDRKGTVGSPYAVQDFRKINPDYGTEQDLRELVAEIHRLGMKIIIGIVPNHGANDNILMGDHSDWFMRDEKGNFLRENPDWSDITDLNYNDPELRKYMLETLIYWIKEFDIDGFRCDVAGMVPFGFWEEVIPELNKIKEDLFLLAEWEDPRILLAGFNSDYGWTEYHLLKNIREGKNRSAEVITLIKEKDSLYPQNALPMRFLENHDKQRSLKVFGVQGIGAYATLLFTLPGIPLIYAGQELGETGKPSLFEKGALGWSAIDSSLLKMYQSLIKMRKQFDCFSVGNFVELQTASISGSVGSFVRESDHSIALVVCNLRSTTSEKVLITAPSSMRSRFQTLRFANYFDQSDSIHFKQIYFDSIDPFKTLVYIANK
jgi:cyclomaltodextrinase